MGTRVILSNTRVVSSAFDNHLSVNYFLRCLKTDSVCEDVTLCVISRAAEVKFKASCDSPRARGAEGHLPWLGHTTHGVTVTLRPEEKHITLL